MTSANRNLSLTQKEKINLIFDYIFNSKKHIKEEEFWNKLSQRDVADLEKIKDEPSISLKELKSSL